MKNFLSGFFSGAIIIFMIISAYFKVNNSLVADNKTASMPTCSETITNQGSQEKTLVSETSQKKVLPQGEINTGHQEQDKTALLVKEITDFQKFASAIPNTDISSYAPDTFKNEPVDSYWASDYQLMLDNYFRNEPELNNLIPQSIECKTSLCKISFAITDAQEQNSVSMQFLSVLKNNKNKIPVQVLFGNNPEALDIYIPRSDKGFFSKSIN
jgi:hypothetical protein